MKRKLLKFKELRLRRLNYNLSRLPIFKHFYRWIRGLFISSAARQNWRIHDWVMDGLEMTSHILDNNVEFVFSKRGCFVKAVDGAEYEFDTWPATSMNIGILKGEQMVNGSELGLILKNVSPGSNIIDVGAGIGELALNIALKIPGTKIFCFEPNQIHFSRLKKNIEKNQMKDRIFCYSSAVADKKGSFSLAPSYTGGHLLFDDLRNGEVDTITIDDFLSEKKISVSFLKSDIEGAELLLLKGAKKCLIKDKPYLQLEIFESGTKRFGYAPQEIFQFLDALGYGYVLFAKKDGSVIQPQNLELNDQLALAYNFFFYHKTKPFIL